MPSVPLTAKIFAGRDDLADRPCLRLVAAKAASVRLIHWHAGEAGERAARLRAASWEVDASQFNGPAGLRSLRENKPLAVVIDLSRLPMQGRDVGLAVRQFKSTRFVPVVFVDGLPEKVARVRRSLPDAVFTSWETIRRDLKRAVAHPPRDVVAPGSLLAGYSGTPLAKKLGIKPDSVVALAGAPDGFEKTLGDLPGGVNIMTRATPSADLIVWFVRSRKELERGIRRMAGLTGKGGTWIAWPKKTSPLASDLTQAAVRKVGLASGLVDYKVCAIDADWSGLKFARRK